MAETTSETGDIRNSDGTFKPGVSGNPSGRPSVSLTTIIKKKLGEVPLGQLKELQELVAEVILEEAYVKRNPVILKELWHYIDGSPKQTVAIDADKESLETLTNFFREVGAAKQVKKSDAEPKTNN